CVSPIRTLPHPAVAQRSAAHLWRKAIVVAGVAGLTDGVSAESGRSPHEGYERSATLHPGRGNASVTPCWHGCGGCSNAAPRRTSPTGNVTPLNEEGRRLLG